MNTPPLPPRHRLFGVTGLTEAKLASIGAIAILASHTEHYTERAIWALEGGLTPGQRPWTDSKPISQLIERLEVLAAKEHPERLGGFISTWCSAARPTFECRHSMIHGTAGLGSEDWSLFTRNASAGGVRRKRPPSEFHATEHTLRLLENAFEDCFTGIWIVWKTALGKRPDGYFEKFLKALQKARSVSTELGDLSAAYNHEKY